MSTEESATKTLALIIYEGLTPLDLVGPLQVLTTLQEIAHSIR